MDNSFRITIIKIIIIIVDITKVYSIKPYFITKKCDVIKIFTTKGYIIIREYNIISFSRNLLVTNQSGKIFNAGRQTNLYDTFVGSYIYRGNVLA